MGIALGIAGHRVGDDRQRVAMVFAKRRAQPEQLPG